MTAGQPRKGKPMIQFTLNGQPQSLSVEGDMPLLWAIRDVVGLTGTKFGCGQALCGACTVWIDGQPARSCQTMMSDAAGKHVTTIEGASGRVAEAVRNAWINLEVPQCGYCQSGQVMSAVALLEANRKPTDDDIDAALSGNICRCATYQRIRAAVHQAARSLA
jgi:isoquinoline 1-oxidoreductase subunit alpha